jgi:hypothetical protein
MSVKGESATTLGLGGLFIANLGDPGIGGRIILRWIFRKWDVRGVDWIELAQVGVP